MWCNNILEVNFKRNWTAQVNGWKLQRRVWEALLAVSVEALPGQCHSLNLQRATLLHHKSLDHSLQCPLCWLGSVCDWTVLSWSGVYVCRKGLLWLEKVKQLPQDHPDQENDQAKNSDWSTGTTNDAWGSQDCLQLFPDLVHVDSYTWHVVVPVVYLPLWRMWRVGHRKGRILLVLIQHSSSPAQWIPNP